MLTPLILAQVAALSAEPSQAVPEQLLTPSPVTADGHAVLAHGTGAVALGRGWKAYFTDTGVRVVPALGRSAPGGLELGLELESIQRGETILSLAADATPQRAADRVAFQRHAQVVERFDVSARGLELALDFDAEFGEAGALVVRYEVTTTLDAQARGSEFERLDLLYEGRGLSIGGVTGIDADGDTFRGRLSFDGEHLDLILPAAEVDAASWPLTLDPLIGPEGGVGPEGSNSYSPAVSYDAGSGRYLVAWIAEYSLFDWDVVARQLLPDGTPVGGLIGLEVGQAVFSEAPSIGNVRGVGKWAVAWTEFSSLFGAASARLRAVRATDSALSPTISISAGDSSQVDVGGTGSAGDSDAIVVWRAFGQGVSAAEVDLSGATPVLGPEIVVTTTLGSQHPSISRTPGPFGRYLIAWDQPRTDDPALGFIKYRSYDADLGSPSAENVQVGNFGKDNRFPSVDGDGRNWYLSYVSHDDSQSFATDRVRSLRILEKPGEDPEGLLVTVYATPYDSFQSATAFTGTSDCMVAMCNVSGFTPTAGVRVYLQGATFSGAYWGEGFVQEGSELDSRIDAVSTFSSTHLPSTEVRVVWPGTDGQIWFGELDAGVGVTEVDPGCGAPASNRAGLLYPATSVSTTLRVEYDGEIPGLLALSSLGFTRADFPCGPCLLVPNSFGPGNFQFLTTDGYGDAEMELPIPANPALSGFTAWHQWFTVDPLPECAAFGIDASPALELVVQ